MLKATKILKALLAITILSTLANTSKAGIDESMDFSSPYYQALGAKNKLNKLWLKISENKTPYGWYSQILLPSLFLQDVTKSFTETSDTFITQRRKLIHSVGMVAKVALVPEGQIKTAYSGIFKGAKNGLIRLSVAKEPDYSKKSAEGALGNFTPGFGIKFLRSKTASANLIAMFSVDGQSSWNFFKNDFSHNVPDAKDLQLKMLSLKFATAQEETGVIGLKPLAQFDEEGKEETEIKFPFKLVFKPAENLRNKFSDEYTLTFTDQLKQVEVGKTLYEVFAMEKPGDELVRIANIVLKSPLFCSEFGDKHLYFQHNYLEYDYKMHPEWKEHYKNSEAFRKIHEGILFDK